MLHFTCSRNMSIRHALHWQRHIETSVICARSLRLFHRHMSFLGTFHLLHIISQIMFLPKVNYIYPWCTTLFVTILEKKCLSLPFSRFLLLHFNTTYYTYEITLYTYLACLQMLWVLDWLVEVLWLVPPTTTLRRTLGHCWPYLSEGVVLGVEGSKRTMVALPWGWHPWAVWNEKE